MEDKDKLAELRQDLETFRNDNHSQSMKIMGLWWGIAVLGAVILLSSWTKEDPLRLLLSFLWKAVNPDV